MSQAQNPRDNQALLQSMLQRLKLQAGTTNIQPGQNITVGQNTQLETSDLKTIKNSTSPVNGFESTGNIKRDFTVNGKTQETDSSFEGSRTSSQSKEHGHDLLSQTGQLFSPKSLQDAAAVSQEGGFNFTTFKTKTDTSKGLNIGESAEQKQDQNSGFVSKVYAWSPKSPDIQDNKMTFEGVFGATGQNTQTVFNNQNSTHNRKQRSSENKTRRWTQKIKDKWSERPGSFGKKGKNDRCADMISQENSPKYRPFTTGNFNPPSNEESEGTPASVASSDRDKTVSQTSDGNDEYVRSTNDFDLGLGSFSLLDEIVHGQEWAKFLNPSNSVAINEGPSRETMDHTITNHHEKNAGINSISQGVGHNSWTLGTNGGPPDTDIAMTQVSPEPSFPFGINIAEKSQIQSEPMDQGQSQSDMLVPVREQQPPQTTTKTQPVNTVESSSLRGRNSLSRKRQYQSYERIETMFNSVITNGNDAADDGSVFLPDNHTMDNTDERTMNLSSHTPTPCSPVRGVLKPTLSCQSTSSMETVSKKRRMENTRHVRFSEEIITIDPPELGPYDSASEQEEEEEDEEDSFIEEDSEEHAAEPALFGPIRPEQVAPARRPILPAWIRALKRRNTGKKPR